MKVVDLGRSLLIVPSNYNDIRPHQLIVLYSVWRYVASTSVYKNISKYILSVVSGATESFIPLVQMGLIPDFIIRYGIRIQLQDHIEILKNDDACNELSTKLSIVQQLKTMPIAIQTDTANDQHYEVPAKFYDLCLGPRKKYSSGLWPNKKTTFEESEDHMLDLYCQRAKVINGMNIVDLGCGCGSLTLYLIEKFPDCKITSISNSSSQREYIINTARDKGLNYQNINVITCNVADDKGALDRVKDNDLVMTIEMFEHMKNYQILLDKVKTFLKPDGKLFVHIFSHRDYTYHFEEGWMSETFFTGGTMPSDDLLLYFAKDFSIENHWRVNGTNYEKTSNGWLDYLDKNWKNGSLQPVLKQAYGDGKEREWYVNWRLFYLACAELFGYDNGQEWIVSHYLFQKRSS